MKQIFLFFAVLSAVNLSYAQSKVFKEVNDDISSESKTIFSNNSVIGYVVFSQLEKANADSFNYKLTIMDENLNDIGVVNFREIGLNLETVTFDQDVLCLGYMKSTELGKEYSKLKQANKIESKDFIMLQFINLDGKILATENVSVSNSGSFYNTNPYGRAKDYSYGYSTKLKKGMQMEVLEGKGFLLFYGDENVNRVLLYSADGKNTWASTMPAAESYYLNTAGSSIYVLYKTDKSTYGDYSFIELNAKDGVKGKTKNLVDKQGNQLWVKTFEPDPATNKLFIAGTVINKNFNKIDQRIKSRTKFQSQGLFSIDVDSSLKKGMNEKYVYWKDGSLAPAINKQGRSKEDKKYNLFTTAYRDFEGNTFFVSEQIKQTPRIGGIVTSIVLFPTIVVPALEGMMGFNKFKIGNESIYKLTPNGNLSKQDEIDMASSRNYAGKLSVDFLTADRSSYNLSYIDGKSNYLISRDSKNTYIYNTQKKKITRTVPLNKNGSYTLIGPAKEGYVMVVEKNSKEKYTRLSIEQLN